VSVARVSIVVDQIEVSQIRVNDQADSECLQHRHTAIHRQS
jgi:hypothetical protein